MIRLPILKGSNTNFKNKAYYHIPRLDCWTLVKCDFFSNQTTIPMQSSTESQQPFLLKFINWLQNSNTKQYSSLALVILKVE